MEKIIIFASSVVLVLVVWLLCIYKGYRERRHIAKIAEKYPGKKRLRIGPKLWLKKKSLRKFIVVTNDYGRRAILDWKGNVVVDFSGREYTGLRYIRKIGGEYYYFFGFGESYKSLFERECYSGIAMYGNSAWVTPWCRCVKICQGFVSYKKDSKYEVVTLSGKILSSSSYDTFVQTMNPYDQRKECGPHIIDGFLCCDYGVYLQSGCCVLEPSCKRVKVGQGFAIYQVEGKYKYRIFTLSGRMSCDAYCIYKNKLKVYSYKDARSISGHTSVWLDDKFNRIKIRPGEADDVRFHTEDLCSFKMSGLYCFAYKGAVMFHSDYKTNFDAAGKNFSFVVCEKGSYKYYSYKGKEVKTPRFAS